MIFEYNAKLIFNVTFEITLRNFMETIIRAEQAGAPLERFSQEFLCARVSVTEFSHATAVGLTIVNLT